MKPVPEFIRPAPAGACIRIKVQPRSAKSEFAGVVNGELKAKVKAPPVDSAANQALLELLAERFGCARSALRIIRGHTSRHKTVLVSGMTPESVAEKIG